MYLYSGLCAGEKKEEEKGNNRRRTDGRMGQRAIRPVKLLLLLARLISITNHSQHGPSLSLSLSFARFLIKSYCNKYL